MLREICFDTETTGIKPSEGHKLVEIGCIELIDGIRTDNNYHVYINPERDVPQEAVNIHNLTTKFLSDKPIFKEVAQDFLNWIGDSVLIAHNANFDITFLNYELNLIGMAPLSNEVIDSLKLAKLKFPGQKNNLDILCKRFNVDASKRTFHGALLDAELLADVYIELIGGVQKSFDTQSESNQKLKAIGISEVLKKTKSNPKLKNRNIPLTEEILEKHKNFMNEKIKNNLWYN